MTLKRIGRRYALRALGLAAGLAVSMGAVSAASEGQQHWCEGYERGYVQGGCFEDIECQVKAAPQCPVPTEAERGFRKGFNRGFSDGLHAVGKLAHNER